MFSSQSDCQKLNGVFFRAELIDFTSIQQAFDEQFQIRICPLFRILSLPFITSPCVHIGDMGYMLKVIKIQDWKLNQNSELSRKA